jgi:NADH-quinone oxidoreductase subunit A
VLESYVPLLIYGLLLAGLAGAMIGLSVLLPRLFGARKPTDAKAEPYECGVPPIVPGARGRVSVRFYLVAIIFILFDIETVFLIPWAVTYRSLGIAAFIEVLVFIGLLVAAYVYVWKRGVLEWE